MGGTAKCALGRGYEALLADVRGERRADPPTRLVTGNEVLAVTGIEPGPIVGQILAAIEEARFLGDVITHEEALALAAQIARSDEARR